MRRGRLRECAGGQRAERAGRDCRRQHGGDQEPDQVAGRDPFQQQARAEAADDKGRRSPQPHRTVADAALGQAAQRIGVGQRHQRRVEARSERQGGEDRGDARHQPGGRIAGDCRRRGDGEGAAHRVVPVGDPRRQRNRDDAHDHRNREREPDLAGIEPACREPDRQERQLHAERREQRGIEHREPPREGLACGNRRIA